MARGVSTANLLLGSTKVSASGDNLYLNDILYPASNPGGGGGVTGLNGITGGIILSGNSGILVTTNGQNIVISNSVTQGSFDSRQVSLSQNVTSEFITFTTPFGVTPTVIGNLGFTGDYLPSVVLSGVNPSGFTIKMSESTRLHSYNFSYFAITGDFFNTTSRYGNPALVHTQSASNLYTINFGNSPQRLSFNITGNTTFTGLNYADGAETKLFMRSNTGVWNLTFPSDWVFYGIKPIDIISGKHAIFTLECISSASSGVRATWAVNGN